MTNRFWLHFLLSTILQVLVFLLIETFWKNIKLNEVMLLSSLIISWLGAPILALQYKDGQFVGRFMIATTLQMLSVLSVIMAIAYVKIPYALGHAMALLCYFVIHLVLQSAYLIHFSKHHS